MGNLASPVSHLQVWIVVPGSYILHQFKMALSCWLLLTHPLSHHLDSPFRSRDWVSALCPWLIGFLWGCKSCCLVSCLPVASCGPSSRGSFYLFRCFQGARLRVPLFQVLQTHLHLQPRRSLFILLGALPCIMLLWGQFLQAIASNLLIYNNLNGLINPKPISLKPKLLSLFL